MRCLASFDPAKLTARGDKRHPPPVGYDKMAKTRELDELVMAATLASFCPDTKVRRRPYPPPYPLPYPHTGALLAVLLCQLLALYQ